MSTSPTPAWHPIASSDDLPLRHVFHGQLSGHELAVWRADDGNVNVWENRCLHRGVRLSIGINDGAELKCQYHGWRYANRTAGCTYIPAHPADAPARRISNRTYPAIEKFGLVWSALDEKTPFRAPLPEGDWFCLRAVSVDAPAEMVMRALQGEAIPGSTTPLGGENAMTMRARVPGVETATIAVFVQPVDSARAVIRALLAGTPADSIATLSRYNRMLTRLRDRVEEKARSVVLPCPLQPQFEPVPVELSTMPDIAISSEERLRVKVRRKWQAGADVVGLELAPVSGDLPTAQPGAHLDIHLPNGLVRQYSITNGPGEWSSYVIGVKREATSRGGSAAIAEIVRQGDLLAISPPRNNFPLRRDASKTVLVAGGIGLTPLLSMAKALKKSELDFVLHVFARSLEHLAFPESIAAMGESVIVHVGLDPDETREAVATAIGNHAFARHLYVCGPGPMIDAVKDEAEKAGWPEEAVHFEYFSNTRSLTKESSFTVELARSAMTLEVPAGRSILEILRENGVATTSSCEQGACGTCMTGVIEGVPDHQDVYLSRAEKRANTCLMTCVSRSTTARLVLDI